MPSFSFFEMMILFLVPLIAGLVGLVLIASVVWAIWRMTWAHERIEQHVSRIEHLFAEYVHSREREER